MSTTLTTMRRVDGWLALIVFGLVLFGVLMVYSASIIIAHLQGNDYLFAERQFISACIGFVALAITASIDYHVWRALAGWMLGVTYLLLISVFFFSVGSINGAHRWISLGGQTFQPSELAKLTFIMYVSAWLAQRGDRLGSIRQTFLPYLAVVISIAFLMLKEPDFGTLTIILAPAIIIYYVAGLSWKQVLLGLAITALGLSLVLSTKYRRDRIMTFLDPSKDTSGTSYHVKNIAIAIGSGGAWGLGFGQSRQKRLFLPEPHTDSIFAIIVEELGAVRATLLLLVFCALLYRGFRVAYLAPDAFGRHLAVGITSWFGFEAFINLASMLHVVPLVGVPLPFISYGGTSLMVSLIAVGVLLNISRQLVVPTHESKPSRGLRS